MRLIVVSSESLFEEESDWINRMMSAYDFVLHLRKPHSTEEDVEKLIQKIDKRHYGRVVLHDHFSLASKYNLMGVHLNFRNPQVGMEGEYWSNCSISRSCHSIQDISDCKELYSYVTLSPIFDSISKCGYKANFSDGIIKKAKCDGIIDNKVVALGGISSSNIESAKEMGFGGVAVLGTIWKQPTIEEAFKELDELTYKLK